MTEPSKRWGMLVGPDLADDVQALRAVIAGQMAAEGYVIDGEVTVTRHEALYPIEGEPDVVYRATCAAIRGQQ